MRLKLVAGFGQLRQVCDAREGSTGGEHVRGCQRVEHGEAAGGTAADRDPLGIDAPQINEVLGAVNAVLNVHDAPVAVQTLTVGTPKGGRTAEIHVQNSKSTAGPVLERHLQAGARSLGRPAVHVHDEGRKLTLRGSEIRVHGRVVEAVSLFTVRGLPCQHLGRGDEGGRDLGL